MVVIQHNNSLEKNKLCEQNSSGTILSFPLTNDKKSAYSHHFLYTTWNFHILAYCKSLFIYIIVRFHQCMKYFMKIHGIHTDQMSHIPLAVHLGTVNKHLFS
jgi:hypothetical protein